MKTSILFILLILLMTSCIEDVVPPPFTGELEGSAEILRYVEAQGDFINTLQAPALIEPEEVYSNLNNFKIIDVRPPDEFIQGHIENAINLVSSQILNFVDSIFDGGQTKIVLVSKNGQSSSYYTSLLRLFGYKNIFTMNFGMAAWNADFADEWLYALGNDPEIAYYTKDNFPKHEQSNLPLIQFEDRNLPIETRVKKRVADQFKFGFRQETVYRIHLSVFESDYLVCYGEPRIYQARSNGVFDGLGHPLNAVFYQSDPIYDFRSVKYLQTLPANKIIFVYDGNGQLSAAVVAYLRLLGYEAVMLEFGANQLFYSRISDDPELFEYRFSSEIIKNYPYVTGN